MRKERPIRPGVITMPPSGQEAAEADASKTPRKSGKRDRSRTVRLTIDLPLSLDFRLDNIAKTQRSQKGAFALRLIDQGLRGYKADATLKTVWDEISGQVGEIARDPAV